MGTLETYIPGTSTPKATWNDPAGGSGHLNTNPITLDSAGRCILYGDGAYRIVLRDALGNLVFDQVSSTVISAAMLPVVSAPTIADALVALGIQDMIDASVLIETNRAEAAEAALNAAIASEATTRAAADTALTAAIASEATTRAAADTALQAEIDTINVTLAGFAAGAPTVRAGTLHTDGSGNFSVTFSPAFPTMGVWFQLVSNSVSEFGVYTLMGCTPALSRTAVSGTALDPSNLPFANSDLFWTALGY